MPLSPQQRRRALFPSFLRPLPSFLHPLPSFLRRQEPSLANADQTLTEVDTRLTKVDKGCQNLTPSTPAQPQIPAKHRAIAAAHAIPTPPASTFAVNPSGAP